MNNEYMKLSEETQRSLEQEFHLDGERGGLIGGYCEEGFPFYYANQAMATMLGYDTVEQLVKAIDGKVVNTIHPDDIAQVMEDLGNYRHEGATYRTIYRMPTRDGSWLLTVDKGRVVKTTEGRLAIISFCRDVTQLAKRHMELEAQNSLSQATIQNMPGGYHRCSPVEGFPFLYVSDGFLSILGWSRDEIYTLFDNKFSNMLHPDDLPICNDYVERIFANFGQKRTADAVYRLRGKEGWHWVSDSSLLVKSGKETFVQGIICDVTSYVQSMNEQLQREKDYQREREEILHREQQEYEARQRVTRRRYRTMAEAIHGGFFLCKKDERYTFIIVSEQLAHLLGYANADELMTASGGSLMGIVNREDFVRELPKLIYANENDEMHTLEYRLRCKNGQWISVEDRGRRETNDKGEDEYWNFIVDCDELRAAERASKAKSDFLFNMSHDIRTPMNAIIGYTQLLKTQLQGNEQAQDYIGKIETANSFLLSLINNVLELARIESGNMVVEEEPANIHSFWYGVHTLLEPQIAQKQLTLVNDFHVEHEDVLIDETKMQEVLLNVLSNAVKYTPAGGTITATLHELPSDREGYAAFQMVMEDTGIGMSKEYLEHLFEEFSRERNSTQSKIVGTGLGMPIVKKLVELMGGTVAVESELGKGTKFTINLEHRIADADAVQAHAPIEIQKETFVGKCILLAEDNDLNAEIAITILEGEGLKVEHAEDGIVCIDMLQKADSGYYDLILMDIQMPNMDGYKATRIIRALPDKRKANIPILAMTANAFEEDKRDALEAGMNGHIAKPIDVDALMQQLAQVL